MDGYHPRSGTCRGSDLVSIVLCDNLPLMGLVQACCRDSKHGNCQGQHHCVIGMTNSGTVNVCTFELQ